MVAHLPNKHMDFIADLDSRRKMRGGSSWTFLKISRFSVGFGVSREWQKIEKRYVPEGMPWHGISEISKFFGVFEH